MIDDSTEDLVMRTPRFHLRTLMIAILATGLIVGNYIALARQMGSAHSYGFPPPTWKVALLSLVGVMIALLHVGLAYGAVRLGWSVSARLKGHLNRQR